MSDGRLKVSVTAAAVDGRANEAVVALVASSFGMAKRDVTIVSGHKSRRKTLALAGASADLLDRFLDRVAVTHSTRD